ncbi:hypothetical protein B0H14DRAFT_1524584 [Mycena olivaceomarginata]|nr:hypothetical protein B0H14DRAFT_1524584 [Mycena olivaceomarginata]
MLWFLFFLHFLCLRSAFSKLVTTIIDDAFPGDTDSSVSYSSSPGGWVAGSASTHGRVSPDAALAQDGTWHDSTDDTTPDHDGTTPTFMEVKFRGTGIDVRCIIANNKAADPAIPPFTGTKSNYSFFIDDVPQNQDFVHEAGTTGDAFLYNTSVFKTEALSNAPHTLKLLLNGGFDVDGAVLILFDYAIVTSDDGTGDGPVTTAGGTSLGPTTPGTTPAPVPTPTSTPGTSSVQPSSSSQPRTAASSSGLTATTARTTQSSTTPTQSAPSTTPTNSGSPSPVPLHPAHKSNLGAIVGGLAGGLALVFLLLFLWLCRKRSRRIRLPTLLPLPHSIPHLRPRSLIPRRTDGAELRPPPSSSLPAKHNPNRPAPSTSTSASTSSPSRTTTGSNVDPAMRDYVQRLRAEVEFLREQQREMVAMQDLSSPEPPPRYEDA